MEKDIKLIVELTVKEVLGKEASASHNELVKFYRAFSDLITTNGIAGLNLTTRQKNALINSMYRTLDDVNVVLTLEERKGMGA